MGQYHTVYNVDKKEMIEPHSMGDGAKLLEWGCGGLTSTGLALLLCNSNGRGGGDLNVYKEYAKKKDGTYGYKPFTAEQKKYVKAIEKVAGRWAGDRIVVQGDYAKYGDPGYISADELTAYKNISDEVIAALEADEYIRERIKARG